jgi:hypothetical protein
MADSDLYFIFNAYTGLVKIGIANDVPSRLRGLECACGVRLELLTVFPGQSRFEQPLHEAFAEARQVGEWFVPTPDIIGLIDRVETFSALLARYQPKIAAFRRASQERTDAIAEERRQDREREKERLAVVRAEERRVKKEEAERRAKAKRRREEKDAARLAAEKARIEREREEWASTQPSDLAASALIRGWTPDRHAEAVAERSTLMASSQRARNSALIGVRVTR